MGLIKYGKATMTQVARHPEDIRIPGFPLSRVHRRMARTVAVRLNPDNYIYLRNRAISADETWGPNQNWDGWPATELRAGYPSFTDRPIDIDHDPSLVIGNVLDSFFLPLAVVPAPEVEKRGERKLSEFTGYSSLKPGDQLVGHWIENVWAVEKDLLDGFYPHAVEAILDGGITDTSMGADIQYSECSVCGQRYYNPMDPACEHIGTFGVNKGSLWKKDGFKIRSYERCYGVQFFEDSLILPESFNRIPGSEGADVSAKILEVLASRSSAGAPSDEVRRLAGQLRAMAMRMDKEHRDAFVRALESLRAPAQ